MKSFAWIFIVVMGFTTSTHSFGQSETELMGECDYPQTPTVINGRNATEAQMIANQKKVKDYMDAGNAFLECLDSANNTDSDDTSVEIKQRVNKVHNSVVDAQTAVADLWKQALNAYKGKNN